MTYIDSDVFSPEDGNMNAATDSSKVGAQITINNPIVINATCQNYIAILQEVDQTFNTELNCIRAKWKDIQKADELTTEITYTVDDVTNNAEEIAHMLKALRSSLHHNSGAVEDLNTDVVALREETTNATSANNWKVCEDEYVGNQEAVERDRMIELQKERVKLEKDTAVAKATYVCAIADLCEADENLRHLKVLSEELEEENRSEVAKWQDALQTCRQERQAWATTFASSEKLNSICPVQDQMETLLRNVQGLRQKVGVIQKRRGCERADYRHIQQQCLQAVDRIKELKESIASHRPGEQMRLLNQATDNEEPICIEQISTTILQTEENNTAENMSNNRKSSMVLINGLNAAKDMHCVCHQTDHMCTLSGSSQSSKKMLSKLSKFFKKTSS